MKLHHVMNDSQTSTMTCNNTKLCGMIYKSYAANKVPKNIIFVGLFINIAVIQSHPIINVQLLLIIIICWSHHPHFLEINDHVIKKMML